MHASPVSPHEVPSATKPLSVQAPAASQLSAFVHSPPRSSQGEPGTARFGWQVPAPSQLSAALQTATLGSPQAVPGAIRFAWQAPAPSQLSASSHWVADASPQAWPLSANPFCVHAPPPSQVSAFVHSSPGLPQGESGDVGALSQVFVPRSQESTVHSFASAHSASDAQQSKIATFSQTPPTQASAVQASESLQSASSTQPLDR